jgi:flavin-dependent dehydrogenase
MKPGIKKEVDILIIGGGVAGCTAAIALAGSYRIALIDKLTAPVERVGECLPPAARRILKRLDLLDGLETSSLADNKSLHLKNIGAQSYWGSERVQIVDHLRNPDGLGWHLDRAAFEGYLRHVASQRGIECFWGTQLEEVQFVGDRWHLSAYSADKLSADKSYNFTAKFVIDASGRQSLFARKLGVGRRTYDKLIACWATFPNIDANELSTISAGELGWWYSAPLPGNKRVIALHTDPDLIERDAMKNKDLFIELARTNREMTNILERNKGEINFIQTVAANSTRLNQADGQQWAASGDAAMSFDPLSSQGMFNAMAGALQLTELIAEVDLINKPTAQKTGQFQAIYTGQLDQVWEHYTMHKKIYYREEMRWKDSLFWKRRH